MKKILYLFLVLTVFYKAFPQSGPPGIPRIFSEIHTTPNDSGYVVYFSYRIPYNFLIFEKSGSGYNAGFSLGLEVSDSAAKSFKRVSTDREVFLFDFSRTSSTKEYEEGVLELKLDKGKYNVAPYFTDKSSVKEYKLKPQTISLSGSIIEAPLVIDEAPVVCSKNQNVALANFNGDIPFGENSYNIIFPVKDTSVKFLTLLVQNGTDTVFKGNLTESFTSGLKISECEKRVVIDFGKNNPTKNFVLKNISAQLYEGPLTITVFDTAKKIVGLFPMNVIWNNKPMALINYEFAIKTLKNIETENVVDSLLSLPSAKYQKALFEYWRKFNKLGKTKYNSLMTEYYLRVDYTAINFRTISNKSGVETDRGKTYIKFGKPERTERSSSENGKIVETWFYESAGLKFSFIDKTGTGDFILMK